MTALPRETPVVSVVVPAFNAARTLQVAIDSVLSQTLTKLELLIGDDASTDETSALLAEIKDPRVRVFTNEGNLGPGPTRDHLIAQASGKWVAFFDADDAMHPDRLRQLISHAEQVPPCILFDDIQSCHDTADGLVPWRRLRGERAFGDLDQKGACWVSFSQYATQSRLLIKPLVPADFIRTSNTRHLPSRMGEDNNFFLTLSARGLPLRYVPVALYYYRITPGSLTRKSDIRHQNMAAAIADVLNEPTLDQECRSALKSKLRDLARSHTYTLFVEHLRQRRLLTGAKLVLGHPWILEKLVMRVARGQYHRLHRMLSRRSKRVTR